MGCLTIVLALFAAWNLWNDWTSHQQFTPCRRGGKISISGGFFTLLVLMYFGIWIDGILSYWCFFLPLPCDFWHDSIIRTSSCSELGVCWTASSSSWTSAPRPWLIRGRRRIPWLLFVSETSLLAPRRAWGLPSWDLGKGMWHPSREHCPGVWPAWASSCCRLLLVLWNFISICNSSAESWKEEKLLYLV